MKSISLDERYSVQIDGTSDGTQDKYYYQGIWYKTDNFGGEGKNEALASQILECTDIKDYVIYEEVEINGAKGCCSRTFLKENEEYVSIYRLHRNIKGTDIAGVFAAMDFDDQADYIVNFVKKETGVDIEHMLGELFWIDRIILNEDRHFNNIGLIFDGSNFRPAPIFDNGKSFFVGNGKYDLEKSVRENIRIVKFRPFTASIEMMQRRFPVSVNVDEEKLRKLVEKETDGIHKEVIKERMTHLIC